MIKLLNNPLMIFPHYSTGCKIHIDEKGLLMNNSIKEINLLTHPNTSLLFNSIPLGLFIKNKMGSYVSCNDAFKSLIYDLNHPILYGITDEEIPWEESKDAIYALEREILVYGITIESENTIIFPSRKKLILQIKRAPYLNESSEIVGIIGAVVDVTHQKEKEIIFEEANQQKETVQAYLENIISNLPGYVYWKDRYGVMLGCNDRFAINAGYKKASDVIGKTDKQCSWSDQAAIIRKNDLEVMNSGLIRTFEDTGKHPDGSIGTFLTLKAPLKDNERKTIGIVGIAIDISDRKLIENQLFEAKKQAEGVSRAKSEFLACISHDLRTPLNGILGMAQILNTMVNLQEENEYISDIIESGLQLKSLIEDILSLAELESGEIQFDHYKFDFRELVESTINSLKFQARNNRIELLIYYGDNVPRFFYGDTKRLKQVLMNLLGNAIKFTHRGHVILSIEPMDIQEEKVILQVSVEDTGIGIPEDKIASIFEKFTRVSASYKDKYEGSGLGLTIVKQIVERMGGGVGVNSQFGKGAIFWFTVTLERAKEEYQVSSWQQHNKEVNILIVDDNEKRAQIILKQTGVAHGKIINSHRAYEQLLEDSAKNIFQHIVIIHSENQYDLLKLVRLIKNAEELNNPIMLLVDKPDDGDSYSTLKKCGIFKYISTPIQPSELSEVLNQAWQTYQKFYHESDPSQAALNGRPYAKLNNLKILLVEDNFINQKVQHTILSKSGHHVDIADSGTNALKMCEKQYDLIIMDLGLPDMSGIEVAKRIRQMKNSTANVPIIAITAHASDKDREKCYASGMNGYLSKPFYIEDIQSMVANLLNKLKK